MRPALVLAALALAVAAAPGAQAQQPARVFTVAGSETTAPVVPSLCDGVWLCDQARPWPEGWTATGRRFSGTCLDHFPDGALLLCSGGRLLRVGTDGRAGVVPTHGVDLDAFGINDAAAIPGGGLMVAGDWGVVAVAADGAARQIVEASSAPYAHGLAALPDGSSALVAEEVGERVVRLWPDGRRRVLAGARPGRGVTPAGVPATAARLHHPTDVALLADGSFVVADNTTGGGRVLRVDPGGTMRLIAGGGPCWREGAPATAVRLPDVSAIEAVPDRSVLVTTDRGVLQIAPDGTVRTLIRGRDPDAALWFDDPAEVDTNGSLASQVALRRPANIDLLPDEGIVVLTSGWSAGYRAAVVAPADSLRRLAIALPHQDRVLPREGRLDVFATRPAQLHVTVRRLGGAVVADLHAHVPAGLSSLAVTAVRASDVDHVQVDAIGDDGSVATAHMTVSGTRLTRAELTALTELVDLSWTSEETGMQSTCRRASPSAFACRWQYWNGASTQRGRSRYTLRADGLIAYTQRETRHVHGEDVDADWILEPRR